ncbi:acetyl-CoA carboxylase carboxyltransferase subunit alpha [Chitinispirillales bacterium ANBcel5]|uniref:acetyl-CoA carboxylase carboxyltransferase subunit alpha n=1 Tax=Cellulosispirillum alkaliphilum TaxID=3039283 RepID=UPI002A589409|nr:acetyl-CoA carboxylase carboxyltransferase subunit alpha [Chitinispirillales bacterium ANBcel5]
MEREFDFEKPIAEMEKAIEKLKTLAAENKEDFSDQIKELERKCEERKKEVYDNLTPWQTVQVARHPKRPLLMNYISLVFSDFVELHGDRAFGDDQALIGGFAMLGDQKVMLIGHNKGSNVDENVKRNFGMASPDGYRKALRLMRLAEKFNIPIVTFIDTPGAFPGLDAEQRGQAEAIARNLTEMARIEVPIVTIVTGEGGSGGALGIGVADTVLMLSYAVYSVISPEGCASILWRDAAYSPDAAEALKITSKSLLELGVIDAIVEEPPGGAHCNHQQTAESIKDELLKSLKKLSSYSTSKLLSRRFDKFAAMGKFNK